MTIELIIRGNHTTDLIAELQNLSLALTLPSDLRGYSGGVELGNKAGASSNTTESTASALTPSQETVSPSPQMVPATTGETKKPEKLTYKEQDAAVEEMVAGSFKDERYDLLTKGRQKKVDEAFEAPKEEESSAPEKEVSGEADEVDPIVEEVTADALREIMGRLGKDKDGNANQDMLLKIRDLLVAAIPEGEETKVGNVPTDRMAQLYADIAALEE